MRAHSSTAERPAQGSLSTFQPAGCVPTGIGETASGHQGSDPLAETCQIRGSLRPHGQGNPEPSVSQGDEGVETRRQVPHWGKERVQPTNSKGATKVVVGRITGWLEVRILLG